MEKFVSGQIAPISGNYSVINENGTRVGTVYVKRGDRMPPTQSSNDFFQIG